MTISSTVNRITYAGNGATTSFDSAPLTRFAVTDLKVYLTVDATQASTLQTYTTHYTVSGGGFVNMVTAPPTGTTLVIVQGTPATQPMDPTNGDSNDAEVLEAALDRLTVVSQRAIDMGERSLKLAEGSTLAAQAIPAPEALKLLQWNVAATGLQNVAPTLSLQAMTVSSFAQAYTLTQDPTVLSVSGAPSDLTGANFGKQVKVTGSTAVALTPVASARVVGWYVYIANISTAKVTITPANGFGVGNYLAAASLALFPGESCRLSYDGTQFLVHGLSNTVMLDEVTVSGSSTGLQFTKFVNDAAFGAQEIEIDSINPASTADLYLQASVNGGSSWLGTNEYNHLRVQNATSAPTTVTGAGAAAAIGIMLANGVLSGGNNFSGRVRMHNAVGSFTWSAFWTTGNLAQSHGGGNVNTITYNAVRLNMSVGNISGTARLIGYRKRI